MAAWSDLLTEFNQHKTIPNWLDGKLKNQLVNISKHRGGAAVIFYASAFLQKYSATVNINREDIKGMVQQPGCVNSLILKGIEP